MNQDLRESLSAVMDDEGDELSLPRVLKTLEQHPEEADTWRRYHVARSVMKREQAINVSMDFSAQIRARIEQEQQVAESESQPAASRQGKRHAPFSFMGSAAIAAAVSLMVITGVQVFRGGAEGGAATSLPGSNDFALDTSRVSASGNGSMRTNVSLVSLPLFDAQTENGTVNGPIRVNGASTWLMSGEASANDDDAPWARYLASPVQGAGYNPNTVAGYDQVAGQ